MNIGRAFTAFVAAAAVGGTVLASAVYAGNRDGGQMDFDDGDGRFGMLGMQSFEALDANGDGSITQEEIDGMRAEHLAAHDANGDGELSLDEFAGLWQELTRPMTVRAFQALDADGDGTITRAEFDRPVAGMVNRMDRNSDGSISSREYRRFDDDGDDDGSRWGDRN